MAKDDLSIAILLGSLASGRQNESKIPESKLNDERLVVALNNAINARAKIPAEQARYDQLLAELAVKRAYLSRTTIRQRRLRVSMTTLPTRSTIGGWSNSN